jgi:hypothetical protein
MVLTRWPMPTRLLTAALLGALAAPTLASGAVAPEVDDFAIFFSHEYEQTKPTRAKSLGYYFAGDLDVSATTDFTGATLTTPTNSYVMSGPAAGPPPFFTYETTGYITETELKADFPAGTYTADATNSSTGANVSVDLRVPARTHFAPEPKLTAASYDGLSGLDPSEAYTFSFNKFTPPTSDLGIIFFTITDVATHAVTYSTDTENLSTTDFVLPADTLAADTNYDEELDFSTRDEISKPHCVAAHRRTQCPPLGEIAWDSRTEGFFTSGGGATAIALTPSVPETSTWAMMLIGFAGLGFAGYRSRKAVWVG